MTYNNVNIETLRRRCERPGADHTHWGCMVSEFYQLSLFGEKFCRGCDRTLPFWEFAKKAPGNLHSRCKDCVNAWCKQHYKENVVRRRKSDKDRYEKNREEILSRRRKSRKKNRVKINAQNCAWRAAHPDKVREYGEKQRARRRGVIGRVSEADFRALCEQYSNRCLACGRSDIPLTRDHVVPLIKGGAHHINNIQPLCLSCNCSKQDKTIDYRTGGSLGKSG